MPIRNFVSTFVVITAVTGLLGCESPALAEKDQGVIQGTVTYRERILLPPGAIITVGLEDVSLMDVPATLIAETSWVAEGGPPYAFSLPYPTADISDGRRYGLRVRIEHEGKLWFINDTHIDPFSESAGESLDIVLKRVGHPAQQNRDPSQMPDAPLTGTYWKAVLINETSTFVPAGQREIHMVLQGDGLARGHSGCNTFRGPFTSEDNAISFGGLASTRMACAEGMEQEQRFLQALTASTGFRIQGDTLTLMNDEGDERLYFEAVYLR